MDTSLHTPPAGRALLPPGPRPWPIVGSALTFGRDPLGFLHAAARRYGDLVGVRIGRQLIYMVNHPDQIEEVLISRKHDFVKEPTAQMQHTLDYALFGNGLLTSEGEFWLRQRRLAQPAFHRPRIAAYSAAMVAHTERLLSGWRDGQNLDVHQAMMRLTLEIVAETLFGGDVTGDAAEVGAALDTVMQVSTDQLGNPFQLPMWAPTPGNRRFRSAVRRLETIVYKLIAQRRAAAADRGDLLSMLLAARDDEGGGMTDKQLRDELVTMFLAGHETTALALSWTWYLLARHPEVEARLHAEVDAVLGGRAPTLADLPQLGYTGQVLKEVLRLYPPAWIMSGRIAVRDLQLGGYHVPAGTMLLLSQWVTHHDARWFPEPERFRPERWADEAEQRLPKFAYFPFGGGPRLCIGQAFALMEAQLIVATIAQRYRLALIPGQRIVPQPAITLRPRYGVQVRLSRR